ncbi:glycosyltransferase family 4 protein [Paenibacillus sp. MBLB4367]|uniref:glycosyltransferase family 4 protein n=1 Tax=Paenibacillus sp. MBLB4367 TaxID=3384767 RepID=UPI003907ED2D
MKILLVTHHLCYYGGSETYLYTAATGLRDAGHDVFIYAPFIGKTAEQAVKAGITVDDDIYRLRQTGGFDVIHAQHNIPAMVVRELFPSTPMLLMVHGALPLLEQPPAEMYGIDPIVCVSREIYDHLKRLRPAGNLHIVHNCVDTKRFRSRHPINRELKRVLVLSNHFPAGHKRLLEEACGNLNATLAMLGMPGRTVWNTEDYINDADLVVTLGRGAMESMACGRAVMVYDVHGADGMLTESSFRESLECNLSGRKRRIAYTLDGLLEALAGYDPEMGATNRRLAETHFNVESHVAELERLYESAIASFQPIPQGSLPGVAESFLFYQRTIKGYDKSPF